MSYKNLTAKMDEEKWLRDRLWRMEPLEPSVAPSSLSAVEQAGYAAQLSSPGNTVTPAQAEAAYASQTPAQKLAVYRLLLLYLATLED